jgi:hypothetical protein
MLKQGANLCNISIFATIYLYLMTVVTITSDWEREDYYLGQLKGRLFSLRHDLNVVEISRSIPAHDVHNESFILRNTYNSFPPSSIHLMCVFSEPYNSYNMAVVFYNGHYFVGLNDGRFSYLFDNVPSIAFGIPLEGKRDAFSALTLLVKGVEIITKDSFETETFPQEVVAESARRVVCDENSIIGRVVHIDSYGNVISNIEVDLFNKISFGRPYLIYVGGPHIKFSGLSGGYDYTGNGGLRCFFNSAGLLEISLEGMNLSRLENIDSTTEIRIKFLDGKPQN